jgi:hypothetical protein
MLVAIVGPRRWRKFVELAGEDKIKTCWDKIRVLLHSLQIKAAHNGEELEVVSTLHAGLDLDFAKIALELGLPLRAILSCDEQSETYTDLSKGDFDRVLSLASNIKKVTKGFHTPGCIRSQTALLEETLNNEESVLIILTGKGNGIRPHQQKKVERLKTARTVLIRVTSDPRSWS